MVMMPVQTNGLNQLDTELHPHGSAIINTMQQVAGSILKIAGPFRTLSYQRLLYQKIFLAGILAELWYFSDYPLITFLLLMA